MLLYLDVPGSGLARKLPVLNGIDMTRVIVIATFALSMLAGFGLQRILTARRAPARRAVRTATLAAALIPLIYLISHPDIVLALPSGAERWVGLAHDRARSTIAAESIVRWSAFALTVVFLLRAV